MKLLVVNYHYFIHGGPDRYFFNVKELLEQAGHTVIPFSFNYKESYDTPYRAYFPEPISGPGTFLLDNLKLSPADKLAYMQKMFWNSEVEQKFIALLLKEKPDVVFSIYLSSSLLPKILHIAKQKFRIPVIYRLSDFHMFCPSYLFFRNGNVCNECLDQPLAAIAHKCIKGSTVASALRALQMYFIKKQRWYDSVDRFICPSEVMCEYLLKIFPKDKILHIPTFTKDLTGTSKSAAPYILYFGKVTPEKGVETLVRAYDRLENPTYPLKIVGHCKNEYRQYLFSLLSSKNFHRFTITDPQDGEEMWDTVRGASFIVQPAVWLENMPNTLIEALSAGKPIIASRIGSLTELVFDGVNGLLVEPGDVAALTTALDQMMTVYDLHEMGNQSRLQFLRDHTEERHLTALMSVCQSVMR
jgi:glycosyltransferase involved in cell wall biosynthesis